MSEPLKVKNEHLFQVIQEIIAQGRSARLPVRGSSMHPFLRDGADSVELTRTTYHELSRGDVVLIRRKDGAYVMHRVIRKNPGCFYMVGDAQQLVEGPLYPDQVIAKAAAVWRRNKQISTSSLIWRGLAEIWLMVLPWRRLILITMSRVKRLIMPGGNQLENQTSHSE